MSLLANAHASLLFPLPPPYNKILYESLVLIVIINHAFVITSMSDHLLLLLLLLLLLYCNSTSDIDVFTVS